MTQVSLLKQLKKVENQLDKFPELFLNKVADYLVAEKVSPVDTGAYIESHTITTGRTDGRARRADVRRTSSNPQANRDAARALLAGDIAALPKDATKVYVNNRSPHAKYVENGSPMWKNTGPYKVYANLRLNMSRFAQEAAQEARNL